MVDTPSDSYESHIVMETRKRRVLSISEKIELIRLTEKYPKNKKAIAAEFKISVHTLHTIYASREKILEKCKGNFTNMNLKRFRPSTYPDIEESLFNWYKENHTNGHISGLVLREKALKLAKVYGHENFTASSGWIERFKTRHNLKFRKNEDKIVTSSINTKASKDDLSLNEDKSNISQSENSYEADINEKNQSKIEQDVLWEDVSNPNVHMVDTEQESHSDKKIDRDIVWENVSNPNMQLIETKQECTDNKYSCPSPLNILPDIHLTETNVSIVNSLVSNSNNESDKINYYKYTIHEMEDAFNVVHNYIGNCDENVNERIFEALSTLKNFITAEKKRKAQSKITDYFVFSNKCHK